MLVVGLTGGIGSGKSTVAQWFAAHGIPVIDADVIARELTTPGTPALAQIRQQWGDDLLTPAGELDRAKLRERVLRHSAELEQLEQLLHPLIEQRLKSEIDALKQRSSAPYCLVVIPLLLETNLLHLVDYVLVVDAPESVQIARVMQRDGLPRAQLQAILKRQASRAARRQIADEIIDNSGSLDALAPQIDRLDQLLRRIASEQAAR